MGRGFKGHAGIDPGPEPAAAVPGEPRATEGPTELTLWATIASALKVPALRRHLLDG
ncbi:hypothetical protein SAMN07250955_101134 [Arboricoccus pini]|uniref:Uncharacterized protein n=1 Tax=Arboricoccus pini TaxID=1963835 RepID=A0A212PXN2_9PROT|nr:hypothetical protein SAMN07250955_101134 [Arboricoccus pini]